MHMNDYVDRDNIRDLVAKYLISQKLPCKRKYKLDGAGAKNMECCTKPTNQKTPTLTDSTVLRAYGHKIFAMPLKSLPKDNVMLTSGQVLPIPTILQDLCVLILREVETEGIFRLAGSAGRQNEIKSKIENNQPIKEQLDVIDVAAVVKYFLRQIPDTLVPETYHKLFLACFDRPNNSDLLLKAVLLLPIENINLLTYLMQFLNDVSISSSANKMTPYNLAVCIAPNIFQVATFTPEEYAKYLGIVKIWIDQSKLVGMVTEELQRDINMKKNDDDVKDSKPDNLFTKMLNWLNMLLC